VASAISLLGGDRGEGLLLVGFALLSGGLVIFQRRRGERATGRHRAGPSIVTKLVPLRADWNKQGGII